MSRGNPIIFPSLFQKDLGNWCEHGGEEWRGAGQRRERWSCPGELCHGDETRETGGRFEKSQIVILLTFPLYFPNSVVYSLKISEAGSPNTYKSLLPAAAPL